MVLWSDVRPFFERKDEDAEVNASRTRSPAGPTTERMPSEKTARKGTKAKPSGVGALAALLFVAVRSQ